MSVYTASKALKAFMAKASLIQLNSLFPDGLFNYTLSFRDDSTYQHTYGEMMKYHDPDIDTYNPFTADKKSHLLLWLVSHCKYAIISVFT